MTHKFTDEEIEAFTDALEWHDWDEAYPDSVTHPHLRGDQILERVRQMGDTISEVRAECNRVEDMVHQMAAGKESWRQSFEYLRKTANELRDERDALKTELSEQRDISAQIHDALDIVHAARIAAQIEALAQIFHDYEAFGNGQLGGGFRSHLLGRIHNLTEEAARHERPTTKKTTK